MDELTKTTGDSDTDGLAEKRSMMLAWEQLAIAQLPPASPEIEEFWHTITLPDGFESRCRVFRPKAASRASSTAGKGNGKENEKDEKDEGKKGFPLIVLFHGGGFALGSAAQMTRPGREVAERLGAVVVSPTYKQVPEEAWPAPMRSAWDVLVYLSKNAESELGASLDGARGGFLAGGFSAGASLALVCAGISLLPVGGHGKLEDLAKPLTGVFANCPMLLTEGTVPEEYKDLWTSRVENRNAEGLDADGVELIWRVLAPDLSSPWSSPFACLARFEQAAVKALPFFFQVGRLDALRDDGVVLEKALSEMGVRTKMDIFLDDGHMAWIALPWEGKSKEPTAEESTLYGIKWLLGLA